MFLSLQVQRESARFESLMQDFMAPNEFHIDYMVQRNGSDDH